MIQCRNVAVVIALHHACLMSCKLPVNHVSSPWTITSTGNDGAATTCQHGNNGLSRARWGEQGY